MSWNRIKLGAEVRLQMISLYLNKVREFKPGDVMHLKITGIYKSSPGKWGLYADDITPLEGVEPTSYRCVICGTVEEAQPDGSPPDGWLQRKFEQGVCFVCGDEHCQKRPMCRVCGYTPDFTDKSYWPDPTLCNACAQR